MKSTFTCILFILMAGYQLLEAQCPATVPTFSVNTPDDPAQQYFWLSDAIRNQAGEMVTIGYKLPQINSPSELYFARFNGNGQLIGAPNKLALINGLPIVSNNVAQKSAFIIEALNASGGSDGYFIAVNTSNGTDKDVWMAKLNTQGCFQFGKRLGATADGIAEEAKGLIRPSFNQYVVLTSRDYSGGARGYGLYSLNLFGNVCNNYDGSFGDSNFSPMAIAPVNSTAFGTAKWVVCGYGLINSGGVGFVFLDNNFTPLSNTIQLYESQINAQGFSTPFDVVEMNGAIYAIGEKPTNSTKGWLMKLSPGALPGTLLYNWTKILDVPDNPNVLVQTDRPWDIEAKNDTLAIAGFTVLANGTLDFKPWLTIFDNNGNLLKSKSLSHSSSPFGIVQKVINLPNMGYLLAGQGWANLGQFGGTQNFVGRCDKNGVIGNCECGQDMIMNITPGTGAALDIYDHVVFVAPCVISDQNATCLPEVDTREVCFQPPVMCTANFNFGPIPGQCFSLLEFHGSVTGMSGNVTYTWDFGPGSGSGQTVVHDFSFPGFYTVVLTATDGICTATATQSVFVQPDFFPPIAICKPMVMAPLNNNGTVTLNPFDVDNGTFDDCFNFGLMLNPGTFNCSNLGDNIVTLMAFDNSGNSSTCTSTVVVKDLLPPTVNCPANLTVSGMEDANGNCVATVSNIGPGMTDNCPPPTAVYFIGGQSNGSGVNDASGFVFQQGLSTVRYIVSDGSNNSSECQFTVTVEACGCSAACVANSLIINTGFDPITNTLTPTGQYTPFWTLIQSPDAGITVPRPAFVVVPDGAWSNQANTRWLSAYPNASLNANNPSPLSAYVFENCFCVCADQTTLIFDISALADNNLSLDLYTDAGVLVGNILNITNIGQGAFLVPTTAVKTFVLQKGNYCLRAGLRNLSGVAMGMSIKGTITGAGMLKSACCGVSNFVTGQKYIDTNCNGVRNNNENGSAGWTIQLIDPSTNAVVATSVTDNFGYYVFENIPTGNYILKEVQKLGYTMSQPAAGQYLVNVQPAAVVGGLDFGNCLPVCPSNFLFSQANSCDPVHFIPLAGGTAPFTYNWNFGGLGTSSLEQPVFEFPLSGVTATHNVCVTITDAAGCIATVCKIVTVSGDVTPPTITCPANLTLNTNSGACYATANPVATANDNCPPATITYVLSGATTGTNLNTQYNLGLTTVMATALDQVNLSKSCTFTILVQDKEKPVLDCPPNHYTSVPRCNNGSFITFPIATATDNCSSAMTVSCDYASGLFFFPCDNTIVTCSATDAAGNTGTCSFNVLVNCECASITSSSIICSANNPKLYNFQIQVQNQTAGMAGTIEVLNTQANVIISSTYSWNLNTATITGTLLVADPVPNPIHLDIKMTSTCSFGLVTCSLTQDFTPPCCESVTVFDDEICHNLPTKEITLDNCSNLYDVQSVAWYFAPAPCPPPAWGLPKQVKQGCDPLLLLPKYLTGDICVYAEVTLGNNPCKTLISNSATLNLCATPTLSLNSGEACYTGSPVQPDLLNLTITNADCAYDIAWYAPSGQLVQTGGLSYHPGPVSYSGSPTACYQDFVYTVTLTNSCETVSAASTFRLYNNDAPIGSIVMNPVEALPLCPGEDIELDFIKNCVKPTDKWTWKSGIDGINYLDIPGAGSSNPDYNSNRLFVDTWFMVEGTNGACQPKQTVFKADVRDALEVLSFTAAHAPTCNPNSVEMVIDFNAQGNCNYSVSWYRNGELLAVDVNIISPATHTWLPLSGESLSGVFYAVVENDCCDEKVKSPIVQLKPPSFLLIKTPCFICKNGLATISASIENQPDFTTANYTWSTVNGMIISPPNLSEITVNQPGTYDISVNVGGCIKTGLVTIVECSMVGTDDISGTQQMVIAAIPNPTTGYVQLSWSEQLPTGSRIYLTDGLGRTIRVLEIPENAMQLETEISDFPEGMYFARFETPKGLIGVVKLVKQ
jgi:hypothetical protein